MPRPAAALVLLLSVSLAACGAAAPTTDSAADAAAAEGVVDRLFATAGAWDYDALRATATADFELVEDTLVMDMDGFIAYLEGFRAQDASGQWTLTDRHTEVSGDVAWTRYRNRGDVVVAGQASTVHWIESAVLLRQPDGSWKIDRLQSNTVRVENGDPAAAPPATGKSASTASSPRPRSKWPRTTSRPERVICSKRKRRPSGRRCYFGGDVQSR